MATPESKAFAPDITPIADWNYGQMWEDISLRDINLRRPEKIDGEDKKTEEFEEAILDFYSWGRVVVEADLAVTSKDNGKVAYIDEFGHPEDYIHDRFSNTEAQLISAFKTVFVGFQLDKDVKRIEITPSDPEAITAILRAGVPEGWKRKFAGESAATDVMDWEQAWQSHLAKEQLAITYERQPELKEASGGLALAASAEIQPVPQDPGIAA